MQFHDDLREDGRWLGIALFAGRCTPVTHDRYLSKGRFDVWRRPIQGRWGHHRSDPPCGLWSRPASVNVQKTNSIMRVRSIVILSMSRWNLKNNQFILSFSLPNQKSRNEKFKKNYRIKSIKLILIYRIVLVRFSHFNELILYIYFESLHRNLKLNLAVNAWYQSVFYKRFWRCPLSKGNIETDNIWTRVIFECVCCWTCLQRLIKIKRLWNERYFLTQITKHFILQYSSSTNIITFFILEFTFMIVMLA